MRVINFVKMLRTLMGTLKRNFFSKIYATYLEKQGVELSGNIIFWGKPKFQIAKGTRIIIGDNCRMRSSHTSNLIGINRPCILSTHGGADNFIKIGEGTGLSGTVIGAFSQITIGKNVKCGANTLITDSDWHLDDPRSSPPRPIVIGDNVWLGVNVVVLKGVTIGENSVIGANSLVVKDIPANVIAAGNPCKVIKSLT
jgi:acetyltransferase-like isoleucine patch superfamily enzyme